MKYEKKNNQPWEKATGLDLAKAARWGVLCVVMTLVVALSYHMLTAPHETAITKEPNQSAAVTGNAPIGGGVNVEDLGYKQLVVRYVDENGYKLLPDVLTWVEPGKDYFVEIPKIEGYATYVLPYYAIMGDCDRMATIPYYSDSFLDENATRPVVLLLQSHGIDCVYDEEGNAIYLAKQHTITSDGDNNFPYEPLEDVNLPEVVYVDKEQKARFLQYDGGLYITGDYEGRPGIGTLRERDGDSNVGYDDNGNLSSPLLKESCTKMTHSRFCPDAESTGLA